MYPAHYAQLFPAFPTRPRVFVAMNFAPEFRPRWESVIAPAIRQVRYKGVNLDPHRVDTRVVSDSILTEILDGISHDAFFLSDITATRGSDGEWHRNANVLYEVGIAHALRCPEEVLLFRSDDAPLIFDVANVRVNRFSPEEDPGAATASVSKALVNAASEVDLQKAAAVERTTSALDLSCWLALADCTRAGGLTHPPMDAMGRVLGSSVRAEAINRLLELGVLATDLKALQPHHLTPGQDPGPNAVIGYRMTPLGEAVARRFASALGFDRPEIQVAVATYVEEQQKRAAAARAAAPTIRR